VQSVEKKIETRILHKKAGVILFPEDFTDLGSNDAIRLALHRLEKKELIRRIAQGIYVRPRISEFVGEITPTAEDVAEAIAKRDKIKMIPTGVYALNALGLSTQVPMNIVFLTDGSPREIKIGKRSISLKKTTPKNLKVKGRISGLVIQALREIGNNNVSDQQEKKIIDLLKKEDQLKLKHDISLAPVWIQKIMKKAINNE